MNPLLLLIIVVASFTLPVWGNQDFKSQSPQDNLCSRNLLKFTEIKETSKHSKTMASLDSVLENIAQLTLEYEELLSTHAGSTVLLKALKANHNELEAILNEAGFSENEKDAVKQRLTQLVENLKSQRQEDATQGLQAENKAREGEKRIFQPLFKLDNSPFATNVRATINSNLKSNGVWFGEPKDHRYFLGFQDNSGGHRGSQGALGVVLDSSTGKAIKFIKFRNSEDRAALKLSEDGLNVYYRNWEDHIWYSISLKDILSAPTDEIYIDDDANKIWDKVPFDKYPYGYQWPFYLSSDKILLFQHPDGLAPVIRNPKAMDSNTVAFILPPETGLRFPAEHTEREGSLQTTSGSIVAFNTLGIMGDGKFISIFDLNSGSFLGSLNASDSRLGFMRSNVLNKDSMTVIGQFEKGIGIWSLKTLSPQTVIEPKIKLYEEGRSYGGNGVIISPDLKYLATVTKWDDVKKDFVDIYSFDSVNTLKFEQSLSYRRWEAKEYNGVTTLRFTPDSDRLIVIQQLSRGHVYGLKGAR